ncbi:LysM peptidoglycan-binding domain-containing protein [Niallia sp. 01092]|uniref:LysM peptidoglycan-binding domain-containing protein n=1 Tax=unclassified Niallia TaxID=2837522 RepID=UPI003FD182C8
MSQENSSTLRFSLEESVWFQRGQEVADLLSISLDPNITIQENDQYITIQGSLELTGEYTRSQENQLEEEEVFKAPKLIHSVMEREEGVCEFLHHFPVDITIPISRITSIDDIEVEIETFDYVFPESSCLNLSADLSIAGLTNGEQQEFQEEEVEEDELDLAFREQEGEEEFAFHEQDREEQEVEEEFAFRGLEDTVELEDNQYEEEPVEITVSPFQAVSPLLEEVRTSNEEAEDDNEVYEPFEVEVRKSPEMEVGSAENNIVPFVSEENKEKEDIPTYKDNVEEQDMKVAIFRNNKETYQAEDVFQKPPQESSESSYEQEQDVMEAEEEIEESSSSDDKELKKKKGIFKKTKTLTFTEFFARKEEETHTKIKVCIVQQGETLEKLSERYNIQVHSILKENRMEANQDIYEGQVLYIPVK